ncbi:hypothetical protein [Micromonospora sp. NBC_01813]|uniref:hypothetical protein n=1 Tax=Micromonospora sp. NBC_01813 TaxID=2975988 RepID=UPI002DDC09C7|nr:hypothetical protein [Micromonospora sp. NBC_01813]WSA09454.1 hypothetical protein OG958_01065 [Micromonospora sp. NBC_01813]
MLRWLDVVGRSWLDPQRGGIDDWSRFGQLYDYATRDREGFLAELQALVAGARGGFATLGAARVVWELYDGDALRIPSAWSLIDAGIEFKRSRGLPAIMLTGYESQRLAQIRSDGG